MVNCQIYFTMDLLIKIIWLIYFLEVLFTLKKYRFNNNYIRYTYLFVLSYVSSKYISLLSIEHWNTDNLLHNNCIFFNEFQISFGDGLPSLICDMCVQNLKNAFSFKKQCESVDISLREYCKSMKVNAIKQELQNSDFIGMYT